MPGKNMGTGQPPEVQIKIENWREKKTKKNIFFSGKYLGSHQEFNQEVLRHFVGCHQFEHLLLVQVGFDLLENILFIIPASRPGASPVSLELQVQKNCFQVWVVVFG